MKTEIEKNIDHPMEEVLDIEPGSTVVPYVEVKTDLVEAEEYDNKDNEIEEQFQTIYDSAMSAFETQSGEAEIVEGKYKARNSEVAVQYLNTALGAVKEKAALKEHKDKLEVAKTTDPKTINNNLIVDRNELLKIFQQEAAKNAGTTIEGEVENEVAEGEVVEGGGEAE